LCARRLILPVGCTYSIFRQINGFCTRLSLSTLRG
jgi:hypothetical protein